MDLQLPNRIVHLLLLWQLTYVQQDEKCRDIVHTLLPYRRYPPRIQSGLTGSCRVPEQPTVKDWIISAYSFEQGNAKLIALIVKPITVIVIKV